MFSTKALIEASTFACSVTSAIRDYSQIILKWIKTLWKICNKPASMCSQIPWAWIHKIHSSGQFHNGLGNMYRSLNFKERRGKGKKSCMGIAFDRANEVCKFLHQSLLCHLPLVQPTNQEWKAMEELTMRRATNVKSSPLSPCQTVAYNTGTLCWWSPIELSFWVFSVHRLKWLELKVCLLQAQDADQWNLVVIRDHS